MAKPEHDRPRNEPGARSPAPGRHWRSCFIDTLAATSNVTRAAAAAKVSTARAYRTRRAEPEFARAWRAALSEGYLHLEMEVVRRLREGDLVMGEGQKFDFANAIRLLSAHRHAATGDAGAERNVSAAEVRASIDRKIEEIRRQARQRSPEGSAA